MRTVMLSQSGRGAERAGTAALNVGIIMLIEREGQRVLAPMALCAMLAVALWMFGY